MPEQTAQIPEITGLTYINRLQLASSSRLQAIESHFGSRAVSLSSLMGPMGEGPQWPSGASWLAIQHNGNPCIVSDGLSDPYVERNKPENGLGLEVYIEAADLTIPDPSNLESLANRWLFPMIAEISHTLAQYPRLCEKLLNDEPLALTFNIEHIKDGRGLVGALLHNPIEKAQLSTNNGGFKLIAATLLTTEELTFLKGKKETGRKALFEKLKESNILGLTLSARNSVI
ncbi:hypothetical protein [Sessilibacter sp. MAH4]